MLITCTKCGQEYSSEAPSCPACGASHEITCHECGKQYASTNPTCPYCGANNLVMAQRVHVGTAVAPVDVHVVGVEWNLVRWLSRHRGLLAAIGAALVTVSLFLPGCYIPTRGLLRIFQDIGTPSIVMLGTVVITTLALCCAKRNSFQFIPAIVCLATVGRYMYSWHSRIAFIRAALTSPALLALIDIEQREGLDTSMYRTDLWALHWGWYVLVAGGLLVLLSSLLGIHSTKRGASPVPQTNT